MLMLNVGLNFFLNIHIILNSGTKMIQTFSIERNLHGIIWHHM